MEVRLLARSEAIATFTEIGAVLAMTPRGAPGINDESFRGTLDGVNLYSIFVSAVGAILVLVIYHAIRRTL